MSSRSLKLGHGTKGVSNHIITSEHYHQQSVTVRAESRVLGRGFGKGLLTLGFATENKAGSSKRE